jgi:hypothetical protein
MKVTKILIYPRKETAFPLLFSTVITLMPYSKNMNKIADVQSKAVNTHIGLATLFFPLYLNFNNAIK